MAREWSWLGDFNASRCLLYSYAHRGRCESVTRARAATAARVIRTGALIAPGRSARLERGATAAQVRHGAARQPGATVREYKKTIRTYPFADPNPIAAFERIYPYFRYDRYTNQPVDREWTVVELENPYIRVQVLPEIGGKIWSAIEKATGRAFIYDNHVVKFRDVAMRGPWTSGGIEPNYGIIGHTPNVATPVDYVTATGGDGSARVTIGTLDLLTRTPWRLEIELPADKAYSRRGRCGRTRRASSSPTTRG